MYSFKSATGASAVATIPRVAILGQGTRMIMRRALFAALATAAVGIASPAVATVTLAPTDGTPLPNQIFGIKDTGNPVYGSSPTNTTSHDVTYTSNATTTMDIKNGFAQINDANSKTAPSWTELIINPNLNFDEMKFAMQLTGAGSVDVYYLLTGSGLDANLFSSYTDTCATCIFSSDNSSDQKFLISGASFDGIMLRMDTSSVSLIAAANPTFFEFKQNSFDPSNPGGVPEPSTWAMMLLGFGLTGFAIRRSRTKAGLLSQLA